MHRRNILVLSAAVASLVSLAGSAPAQQKTIKDTLAGTWTLLLVDNVKDDGTHVPAYGPNPDGTLIFTSDGHFSYQITRYARPAFASKNLRGGTASEIKAAFEGTISSFGTYTVDEASKTITYRVTASSFPNWDDTVQKRPITAITEEVLAYNVPAPPTLGYTHVETMWKKAK
jgi:Lipocalin-like domain